MSGHLISTAAVLVPCDGCSKRILACRAGGFRAHADPQPLSINAEIAAWLRNRPVYDILIHGLPRTMHLEYRNLTRVISGREYPVVAEHECPSARVPGVSVAGTAPFPFRKPEKRKRKMTVSGDDDEIPF